MEFDNEIHSLLKDFYNISGARVSIHDTSFKEIYSYPSSLTPFCRCVQSVEEIRNSCLKSDAEAFSIVEKTDMPYVYKCKCGLYEAVSPIYNYGRLTGYLMLGQVRDNDDNAFRLIVEGLKSKGVNPSLLDELSPKVSSLLPEKLNSYINIMTVLAEHFTRTNKLKSSGDTLARLVYSEILNNLNKAITLSYLSRKFGCSIATITASFKNEYNIGIHQFIINERLKKAAELLKHSDKAIKEISEECGFYDQNHFYRTFRKEFKLSPTEFRSKS